MKRIVVVGYGIAGLTSAETLRTLGFAGEIVVIGEELDAPYSRPALSKALLRDAGDATSHLLPNPSHGASVLAGSSAISLDPASKVVGLDDGSSVSFDGLVIATGCRPRRLGGAGELTLRDLADAQVLREAIASKPSVVVVGGGPLGMEVASACQEVGCAVTVVNQGLPMAAQLGEFLSRVLVDGARGRGVHVVHTEVAQLEQADESAQVRLSDGDVLRPGLVITAVGDVPNVEWLESSGLLRNGRLVADALGRVAPGIVAAGDVAHFPTAAGLRRAPLWSVAIAQAKVAAATLLGQDAKPVTHHYFWTEQFGISLKAMGAFPVSGAPRVVEGNLSDNSALLLWERPDAQGGLAAAAINFRVPLPQLRRMVTI